jgi:hypothetical protein
VVVTVIAIVAPFLQAEHLTHGRKSIVGRGIVGRGTVGRGMMGRGIVGQGKVL